MRYVPFLFVSQDFFGVRVPGVPRVPIDGSDKAFQIEIGHVKFKPCQS